MSQIIGPADPRDGKRILEILESSPAKGSMELLYTRRPDAYASYQKESPEVHVLTVRENETILATVAEIVRDDYIGGERRRVGYLCGMKKDAAYPNDIMWGRGLTENLVQADVNCYFCSVVSDNSAMQRTFSKKRKKTANMDDLGGYTTYLLSPRLRFKCQAAGCTFSRADRSCEREILQFLQSEGKRKDLFPVIESLDAFSDLQIEDFYVLREQEKIVAVGALWDQAGYRQYVVKRYRGMMRCARRLNPILRWLRYIELPRENENVRFPMLAFFLSRDDNVAYYTTFLHHITRVIRESYGMFVIGVPRSNFAHRIYARTRNIHFDTQIYAVEFVAQREKTPAIDKENLWLECGLL